LIREGLQQDHHPGNPDLLYLEALALSRGGSVARTQLAVAALLRRGDLQLPLCVEALSLAGRTWKDLYERARDPAAQPDLARRSAEQYEQAFQLTEDPFPGVNAATMARLAGDVERSRRLAERARDRARQQPGHAADYWLQASLGEAHLLLAEPAAAAEHYRRAVTLAGKDYGSIARMRQQLLLLRPVLPDVEALLGLFCPGAVVAFAGHRIDPPEDVADGRVRFPPSAALEQTVRAAIGEELQRLNAVVGYCAPSCGADLLFAEILLERGGELHVVLPFDREDFFRTRVHYNQDAMGHWALRCQRVLERATVHSAIQEEFLDDHSLFDFADVFLQGLALFRARQLGAEAQALLVLDRTDRQDSGTARFQDHWHTASRSRPRVLDLAALREQAGISLPPPPATAPRPWPRKREVRAMLFADVKNFSKLPDRKAPEFFLAFLRQVRRVIEHAAVPPLFCNTWGDGIFIVTPDVRSCADIALRLLDELDQLNWEELGLPRDTGVRLGLHTGPVFKGADPVIGRENFFGSHVSRAARIEPVTVPGCAFASEQFAACLTVEAPTEFASEYLGVHELAKGYDRCPLYRVLRR
jgi:class 3 adenylate cyclase